MAPSFQPLQDDLIVEWPLLSPCLSDHDYNIYAAHHRHNHNKLFPHSECSTREYCIPAEYCRQNPVRIYTSNKNLHVLVKSRFGSDRGRREVDGWRHQPSEVSPSFSTKQPLYRNLQWTFPRIVYKLETCRSPICNLEALRNHLNVYHPTTLFILCCAFLQTVLACDYITFFV